MNSTFVVASLMILGLAVAPGVTAETPACGDVEDESALAAQGLYVHADGQVWEEDNGIDGLQREDVTCVTENGRARTFASDVQIV